MYVISKNEPASHQQLRVHWLKRVHGPTRISTSDPDFRQVGASRQRLLVICSFELVHEMVADKRGVFGDGV